MVDGGRMAQAGIGAAQRVRHVRMQFREALDVELVDDRVRQRDARRPVAAPVESRRAHDRARDVRCRIHVVAPVGSAGAMPVDRRMPAARRRRWPSRRGPAAAWRDCSAGRATGPTARARGSRSGGRGAHPSTWAAHTDPSCTRSSWRVSRPESSNRHTSTASATLLNTANVTPVWSAWAPGRGRDAESVSRGTSEAVATRMPSAFPRTRQVHDEVGHQPGPTDLMRCAERRAAVAAEALVEQQGVVPRRIAIEPRHVTEAPPPAEASARSMPTSRFPRSRTTSSRVRRRRLVAAAPAARAPAGRPGGARRRDGDRVLREARHVRDRWCAS